MNPLSLRSPSDQDVGTPAALPAAGDGTLLLDAIGAAVVLTGADTRIKFMNEAARYLHGIAGDDDAHVGQPYGTLFHMLDEHGSPRHADSTPVARAARGERVTDEVHAIRLPDGDAVCHWEYSAEALEARGGSPALVVLTVRDSECRGTLDGLPVGVAVCDEQGRVIEANKAMGDVWGGLPEIRTLDEAILYRAWWAESGAPVLPQEWAMYRAVTFGEMSRGELLDVERFDGARATILSSAAPTRNERGTITGAVAVMQDVTDRMRTERIGREILRGIEAVLRASGPGERIEVVAGCLGRAIGNASSAYVSVREGGHLELMAGQHGALRDLLERHAADVWDALRTEQATCVGVEDAGTISTLLITPVPAPGTPDGCFLTLVRGRTHLTAAEERAAGQLVRLISALISAPMMGSTDGDRRFAAPGIPGDPGAPFDVVSTGDADAGPIADAVLDSLVRQAGADHGRVVIAERGENELSVLSETGSPRVHSSEIGSMGVAVALVTGRWVVAPDAPPEERPPFASYATLPFKTDSGGGCVTLAWRLPPADIEACADAARPGVDYLGLLLNSAQLRSRLAHLLEERSFVSAVAAAAASCFDAGGIQEAVSRVVNKRLGAVDTRLFRLDSAGYVREIVPTFAPEPSAECPWAQIEEAFERAHRGVMVVSDAADPLGRLFSVTTGRSAVVVRLRLRGRSIGLIAVTFEGVDPVDPRLLGLLKAAAREVADALAVAEYCAAQARIALRSRVAEVLETRLRDVRDEDDIVELALSTALSALSARGAAFLAMDEGDWGVRRSAGSVDDGKVADLASSALGEPAQATTKRVEGGAAIVSATWVDEQLLALVVLRDQPHGSFTQEDLEILYRIHAASSQALRSLRLSGAREEILAAREQWLADVSHDLKTPLSAIRAYAELLSSPGGTPAEEVERQATRIVRQASEIERLLSDLQLVFRIRARALPVELCTHDANDIALEVVQLTMHDPRVRGQEIALVRTASPLQVEVDRRLLTRALSNLTMNAVVHGGSDADVRVEVARSGDACRIEVIDNGKGIDPREIERVFDRYYRGNAARGDGIGSGLGLPIARELIEMMGGTLTADSEPGRGTTIIVELAAHLGGEGADALESR